jgi:hypothetical protein
LLFKNNVFTILRKGTFKPQDSDGGNSAFAIAQNSSKRFLPRSDPQSLSRESQQRQLAQSQVGEDAQGELWDDAAGSAAARERRTQYQL